MSFKNYFLLGFIFLLFVSAQIIESFEAKVVGVTDGDTVTVLLSDSVSVKIRLDGIDCPEMNQSFGISAKQFSSDLVYGRFVEINKTGTDKYGRILGDVIVSDTISLNKELLKAGLAWHYKKYNSDTELASLEQIAKSAKIGLWADSSAVAPWEFRHGKGNSTIIQNNDKSNTNVKDTNNRINSNGNAPLKIEGNVWICNSSTSYAYHKYKCSGLSRCKNGIFEISVEKAKLMQRTPCKICKW